MTEQYPFQQVEAKWQQYWEEHKLFRAVDGDTKRKKLYVLDMFPYPSGAGLHVGHPEGYTATDIYCRYQRMRGFNVLHPMGWDAFGLPAEQYAIDTGTHPAVTTRKNVATFRKQIDRFGFSYDWDREIDTTDPAYVRWTQWIFLKLYERGLAYQASAPVWWCPACGTVLANEEVVEGTCERKGHPVERRPMRQWMLKITAYAQRLLDDLGGLDWPEHVKAMQRHWIGRSDGAEVWFAVASPSAGDTPSAAGPATGGTSSPERMAPARSPAGMVLARSLAGLVDNTRVRQRDGTIEFKIYTTRPDTLFGATYMVLSPEHPVVPAITTDSRRAVVEQYRQDAARKSELDRTELAKEKTGVFTGAYAINPVNQEKIPIWIADYVLASYGTGAIMAVPAHDQRDLEFALQFGLDVRIVIVPQGQALELVGMTEAYTEPGRMQDAGPFTGLRSEEAAAKIIEWLKARGAGESAVNYKLRDWLFSRQRYWGEPIPIVHCQGCGLVPLPESMLPLELPPTEDVTPWVSHAISHGQEVQVLGISDTPLDRVKNPDGSLWKDTSCPKCKGSAQRETNTMPQWAGSCWYYLRYLDPRNDHAAWEAAKEQYWMPVDLYVGGAEHAVLHLLYARFWHKVLYDLTLVSTAEPFKKLVNQGLILGEDGEKMSKSRGNVVNPDEVIDRHGADAFRLYEMFMGPLESVKPWSTRSIEGIDRFLNRVWRLGEMVGNAELKEKPPNSELPGPPCGAEAGAGRTPNSLALERKRHETIKRVTEDLEGLRFNTAIAAMMEFVNACYEALNAGAPRASLRLAVETLVLLLSPFAPHLAEEVWQRLGHDRSLAYEPWPAYDPNALVSAEVTWVVQVNGKVRAKMVLPADLSEEQLKARVLADEQVQRHVDGRAIQQMIVVPKRLVNIVV